MPTPRVIQATLNGCIAPLEERLSDSYVNEMEGLLETLRAAGTREQRRHRGFHRKIDIAKTVQQYLVRNFVIGDTSQEHQKMIDDTEIAEYIRDSFNYVHLQEVERGTRMFNDESRELFTKLNFHEAVYFLAGFANLDAPIQNAKQMTAYELTSTIIRRGIEAMRTAQQEAVDDSDHFRRYSQGETNLPYSNRILTETLTEEQINENLGARGYKVQDRLF